MGYGNEVNRGTWECSNIMGYGNQVNHVTWESGKSWDMRMREIMGNGKEENYWWDMERSTS